jgi:hypothetical protein
MSQKNQSHEHGNDEHAPITDRNRPTSPVLEISPDDPYPVEPTGGPGKPGQAEK